MTEVGVGAGKLAITLFPLALVGAGAVDVITSRIPNWLTLIAALLFLPLSIATGMPLWTFVIHVVTGLVLLSVGYGLFSLGSIGGGDAKLLAVAGLWLGYPCSIFFVVCSALAGGVLAAAIGFWYLACLEGGIHSKRLGALFGPLAPDVPYGFALAAGAILATPYSWWMSAATA